MTGEDGNQESLQRISLPVFLFFILVTLLPFVSHSPSIFCQIKVVPLPRFPGFYQYSQCVSVKAPKDAVAVTGCFVAFKGKCFTMLHRALREREKLLSTAWKPWK